MSTKVKIGIFVVIVILVLLYFFSSSTEDEDTTKEPEAPKVIGTAASNCTEISYNDFQVKKQEIVTWAFFQPTWKKNEIMDLWSHGRGWDAAVWDFAHDEMLRKGFCER